MSTLHLRAVRGVRHVGRGYSVVVLENVLVPIAVSQTPVATVDDARAAIEAFGTRVLADHPGLSFQVSANIGRRQRGDRNLPGFDAAAVAGTLGTGNFLRVVEDEAS